MYRSARQEDALPSQSDPAPVQRPRAPQAPPEPAAYGSAFWFTYLANTLLMVAVSLLFRYGDFVSVLGGGELELGLIVGTGAIGSLTMRLFQGVGIDRYGPRQIWLLSLVVIVAALAAHLALTTVHGPAIYLVRVVYHTALAGAFGASITYISLRAPVVRMAEMIGMLGSSGFVGMAVGTQLGDALCRAQVLERWHVDRLFLVAAMLVFGSLLSAAIATRGEVRREQRSRPPLLGLVRRYHPGPFLVIAVAMGIGVGLPGTFLRPYTESLNITQIGTFFGVYSVTAFAARLATRRIPDRLGPRPTVLLGMGFLALSMLLYLPVRTTWHLALPGLVAGIAHALLFPAVVAGGSGTFPSRYRGLGVTLTLGCFDLGSLIGMPFVGTLVETANLFGLPGYPTMFLSVALLLVLIGGYFAARRSPQRYGARRRVAVEAERSERAVGAHAD